MAIKYLPKRIVVAHVMWMDRYQGDVETLRNVGHRYARAGVPDKASGEISNFLPLDGYCYGYVARHTPRNEKGEGSPKSMNIGRLGADPGDDQLGSVTVCWTATPGPRADRVVVGWYKNATAYRQVRNIKDPLIPRKRFYFQASADGCLLIPAELRTQIIPLARNTKDGDGPGTDAFFYPGKRVTKLLMQYLEDCPAQTISEAPSSTSPIQSKRFARQDDPASRSEVEAAAIIEVQQTLTGGGWIHSDDSRNNWGWDISAQKPGHRSLRIEVKGLSGSIATVELTRNEYEKLLVDDGRERSDRFVVAIVLEATDRKSKRLQAFSLKNKVWLPFDLKDGNFMTDPCAHLVVTPVVAARCSVVLFPRRN